MEEKEFQEQVNRKFIRPTYRPFDDKPKKIFIRDNEIPTYKIPKPNFEKTKLSFDNDISQQTNTMMKDQDPPKLNEEMYHPNTKTRPINLEKIPNLKMPVKMSKSQPTPVPHKSDHNCCAVYEDIQNCPVCKTVYSQKDGVYIAIITILAVIILLLLKRLYIELHKNDTK